MKRRGNKEGSIFKTKEGYWVAQIHMGYAAKGKPRFKRIQRTTRKEVQEALEEVKRELHMGTYVHRSNIGFNDWIKEHLEKYVKMSVQQTTYDKYETFARVHVYPAFIGYKLQDVTTYQLQSFLSEKAKNKAASTVREIRLVISKALNQAVREKLIRENVALYTTLPRLQEKEVLPLDENNLKKLLLVARGHRLYYALMLLLSTGLRRGELLGLKWSDIDFAKGTIKVVRNYVKTRIGDIFQEPKTRSSRRIINVPSHIMNLLDVAQAQSQPENPWLVPVTEQRKNTEYLPMAPRNFSRLYATWCKKAGLENVGIHTLRHTYASLALSQNVHIKVVQAQLGHSNIKMTMDRYSHLLPSIQQEAAEKMNQKLTAILCLPEESQIIPESEALH